MRSTVRPSVSRLVGSIQWTSSKIISTGLDRDSASTCAVSASSVLCTRFAGEQHHLPLAALRFRPAPQQQFDFFFPSYKLREAARMESLEAAFD